MKISRLPLASTAIAALTTLGTLATLAGAARAEAPTAPVGIATVSHPATDERKLEVGVVLGLWTPVGSLGVDAQYDVAPWLGISGGVGLGFSGTQLAVMPRIHTTGRHLRLFAGLGLSGGRFDDACYKNERCPGPDDDLTAIWVNTEAGVELDADPIFVRFFGGLGSLANDHPSRTLHDGNTEIPYIGATLGAHL